MNVSAAQQARSMEFIAACADPAKVRGIARNARDRFPEIERAALRRIVELESQGTPGTVKYDCWAMILAVEEIRRQARGRRSPMNRLRPKIAKEGEVAALEYLARNESDGFREVLDYGMPELAAESIVIRHGEPTFSSTAVTTSRARLTEAGLDPDEVSKAS